MPNNLLNFSNFFFLGMSNLIGWNVVLTSLDYFSKRFAGFDVNFLMVIPCDIGSLLANLFIGYLITWISMNKRIILSLIVLGLLILILPIEALIFPNTLGFWLFMALNFLISVFMVFLQGSIIGLAGNYPEFCMAAINLGFSVSGILTCFLRMICLWFFKNEEENGFKPILLYYAFSTVMILISFAIYLFSLARNRKIIGGGKKEETKEVLIHKAAEDITNEDSSLNDSLEGKKETYIFLIKSMKATFPYSFLMFVINVQTFLLFPGVALGYSPFSQTQAWNEVLLLLIFNVFDAIGRYLSLIKLFYSKKALFIMILLRNLFIGSFLVLFEDWNVYFINNSIFSIINMIIFAFTNGYFITALFILAAEVYSGKKEKELVGFMMSFMLNIGGIGGSLLALKFANI